MRATITGTFLAAAVLLAPAASAAQDAGTAVATDARWQPWVGCWQPVGVGGVGPSAVCVVPAADGAVEVVTVTGGREERRERIDASGEARAGTRESCAGTDRAEWSPDRRRVYLRSEHTCDGVRFTATGVMAMAATGEWLDVRGVSMAGGPPDVRVRRFQRLAADAGLPATLAAEVRAAARPTVRAAAVANAAAPVSAETVAEASRVLDAAVVEAWLVERGEGFTLDARRLVKLADAGVSSRVIDVMVALSYPKRFAIDRATRDAAPIEPDTTGRVTGPVMPTTVPLYDARRARYCQEMRLRSAYCDEYFAGAGGSPYGQPFGYSQFGYSPYGWGNDPWGFGYGGGNNGRPPVIVVRDPNAAAEQHGRVVKGRGYTRGGSSSDETATPRTSTDRTRESDRGTTRSNDGNTSAGSSAGSSGGSRSTETRSGGESTRKAKPKNP